MTENRIAPVVEAITIHLPRQNQQFQTTGEVGQCRTCHAEVLYVTMPSGKRPPYNRDGSYHNTTCPQAAEWQAKADAVAGG